MVEPWGRFLARRARTVLVAGVVGGDRRRGIRDRGVPALSNGGFDDPGTESANELVAEQDTSAARSRTSWRSTPATT